MGFPHLLAPGRFGTLELPNRIVMPPVRVRLAHVDGTPSSRDRAFYAARARGGAALVTVGSMIVSTEFEPPSSALVRADAVRLLVERFGEAAARVADAGFDAID